MTRIPHSLPTAWSLAALVLAAPALAGVDCPDPEAPDPESVTICIEVIEAESAAGMDGDNFIWDNENDLYYTGTINGVGFSSSRYTPDMDDPHFNDKLTGIAVPRSLRLVPIHFELWDYDFPDPDDPVDIDPGGGDDAIDFVFDTCELRVYGDGLPAEGVSAQETIWFGPGGRDDHGRIRLRVATCTTAAVPIDSYPGDLSVGSIDLVQVVTDADFAVAGRPAVLRVEMSSTFTIPVSTRLYVKVDDGVTPLREATFEVDLGACEQGKVDYFLVGDPPVIGPGSLVRYTAKIDPDGVYFPTPPPPCVEINNGSDDELANRSIVRTDPMSVKYVRFRHTADGHADIGIDQAITDAEAQAEIDLANDWITRVFPLQLPFAWELDPAEFEFAHYDELLGPRTEMALAAAGTDLVTTTRTVWLVPRGFIDRHDYDTLPSGTPGVSTGKQNPFVVELEADIPDRDGITTAHELGHTFGLSEEPCDFTIWDFECEDEYNDNVFRGTPDYPYKGSGYDIVDRAAVIGGICFMDGTDEAFPAWISNNDFEALAEAMQPGGDPRVLLVTGSVNTDGTGEIQSAIGYEEGVPTRFERRRSPFALEVRDAAGIVLGEYGILNDPSDRNADCRIDGDEDCNGIPDDFGNPEGIRGIERAEFVVAIPWSARAHEVVLVGPREDLDPCPADCAEEAIRAARVASLQGAAPAIDRAVLNEIPIGIELLSPIGDVAIQPGDRVVVRWRTETPPPHGVAVQNSYDGGHTWWPRALRVPGDEVELDFTGLARPVVTRFRAITLQDGMMGISDAPPVSALLRNFEARAEGQAVHLSWEVSAEEEIVGYRVYREDLAGERVALTSDPFLPVAARHELTDRAVRPGAFYEYELFSVHGDRSEHELGRTQLHVPDMRLSVAQNTPNPFRGSTSFTIRLPAALEGRPFSLAVFDLRGRRLGTIVEGKSIPGERVIAWNGRDGTGRSLPPGLYVYRLEAGGQSIEGKLVRL